MTALQRSELVTALMRVCCLTPKGCHHHERRRDPAASCCIMLPKKAQPMSPRLLGALARELRIMCYAYRMSPKPQGSRPTAAGALWLDLALVHPSHKC